MDIAFPVFVFDGLALDIFTTHQSLVEGLESQDVARQEYHAYDSAGYYVRLTLDGKGWFAPIKAERVHRCADDFAFLLRATLSAIGVVTDNEADLETLQSLAASHLDIY
jgi:hypothetical protein